jgi:hypothetical protein
VRLEITVAFDALPALGLTLGVDKASAIPGDTLTYTAVAADTRGSRRALWLRLKLKSGGSVYLVSQIAKDAWMARIGVDLYRNGVIYRIPTILIRG